MTDWSHSHTLCTVLAQQLWSVSETSHKSLLKLCSNWRIYFSSSYQFIFPLRRIFPFMKRIPTWNASVYFLSDCDLLRRQENTLKTYRTAKLAMHWGVWLSPVPTLLNQNRRSNAHLPWQMAIGLEHTAVRSMMTKGKGLSLFLWSTFPIFFCLF